jgi:pilus assembly protein CpaE
MRVVVATDNAGQREQLRLLALAMGLECRAPDSVSLADLAVRLSQPADLVLVEAGAEPGPAQEAIRYAAAHTTAPVLAVGPAAGSEEIVQWLRSGAREYVDQARFREDLPAVLQRLRPATGEARQPGRTVAVIAAKPGSGVTTVATTLAFALAQTYPRQVALAELGPGVPELALDLDLEPRHTIADLVRDWDRLDATAIRQALVEHPGGVQILAYPPEVLEPVAVPAPALQQTTLLLRHLFDFSVLDLGYSLNEATLAALRLADCVVVVVCLDVPSLRLGRQLLRRLRDHGIPERKVRTVANRYGERNQIAWKRAEEALGAKIDVWVPDDSGTLNRALNHGKPLTETARRAGITRRIDQLAREVNGRPH